LTRARRQESGFRKQDREPGAPQEDRSAFGLEKRFAYRSRERRAGSLEKPGTKGKIVIRYWFYDCGLRNEKGKNKLPV